MGPSFRWDDTGVGAAAVVNSSVNWTRRRPPVPKGWRASRRVGT